MRGKFLLAAALWAAAAGVVYPQAAGTRTGTGTTGTAGRTGGTSGTSGTGTTGRTGTANKTDTTGTGTRTASNAAGGEADVMLARSSPEYRVTAGDVYTLAYMAGGTAVSYVITVDSSYRIRVSNLGVINGAGKTFVQLKNEVEAVVSNNYPLSGVQLALTEASAFLVYVRGEVYEAREERAWGLSRLSSLLEGENLTDYASRRDIEVKSGNGQSRVYDLYRAQREGDLSQDPYLRPGDVVTFGRAERLVTVEGAVERPGSYQLRAGEELRELVEKYGGGFTATADKGRLELVRYVGGASITGEKTNLSEGDLSENYALRDYDKITVPDIISLRPVIFVEGAISAIQEDEQTGETTQVKSDQTAELAATTRVVVAFNPGEDYAALVRRNRLWFNAVSDTQNSYIVRGGEHLPLNLNPILYDAEYRTLVLVKEGDSLIIPFRQYFVSVAGAVEVPGRYPYIPDRDWEYYIGLAGGFVAGRNAGQSVTITDMSGKKMKKDDPVSPETVITANTNHIMYYFNQYAPVVTTVLSLITTFLTLQAMLSR